MNRKMPSWVVLCLIGLAAGLLLSVTNQFTAEKIVEQEAASKDAARSRVLEAAEQMEELEVEESKYNLDNLFEGKDADGNVTGYVGQTTVHGFGGPIEVITGVDSNGTITGISVGGADFAETAGLGARTQEAAFTDQFKDKTPPIVLNEGGVDTVTGASTSSRAVISGVNSVANYIYTYQLGLMEEEDEVYTGTTISAVEKGFGGNVTVNVGLADDGTIEYLAIDTPDETDGLGKMASEKAFTSQFIGKSGPFTYGEDGIEALTGATFTSTAVINALNTVVSGGGTESAEPVTTTVKGFGGDVTVTAKLNADNSISALTIDTPNETDGLGKRASESEFTSQFIGKMAPFTYGEDGIEALTGATVTSTAVLEALNSIVPEGDKSLMKTSAEAGTETALEEAPAEAGSEAAAPAAVEGEETASATGMGEGVTVHVTKNDDGTIATLTIDTPNETPGIGSKASEDASFAEQFLGKAGPFTYGENGVEAISGATLTSNAVLEALNSLYEGGAAAPAEAGTETALEEAPAEAESEAAAPAAAEGEETASATGMGEGVTVHVTKNEDGTIASLTIDTPNETPGIGSVASEDASFAEQFVGKAGPFTYGENGVEAISGATLTSNAVLEALNSLYEGGAEAPAEAGTETALEEAPAEAESEAAAPAAAEGEETASATGMGEGVTVHVTKNDDGTIATLTIDTPNETPGIGSVASEDASFAEQFVGKAGPFTYGENGVEAISGATLTSNAVLEALNSLYEGEAVAEEEVETETAEEAAEEVETEAAEEAAEEIETEAAAPAAAEGEETASATGMGEGVTVHVTKNDDGTIASLTIDTPNETPGIGSVASEDASFAEQFVGKAGPFTYGENGVEAISGATLTSNAVLEALNSLYEGEAVAEEEVETEAAEEAPEEEATEAAPEEAQTEAAPAEPEIDMTDAETASAWGYGINVTVNVVKNEDDSIAALTIDTPNETPGIGSKASEDASFAEQFVGKTGPFTYGEDGIEAISGATLTSNGVLEALNILYGVEPETEAATEAAALEEPDTEAAPEEEPATETALEEVPEEAEEPATETALEEAPEEAQTEDAADEETASATGMGEGVTVHVTKNEDGSIASLTIDTPNETPGIGATLSENEKFIEQFIGKTGPFEYGKDGVEAVTGVTITSDAVLEALNSLYED